MPHQHILDQWAELNAMIAAARPTTDHPEAHACMNAIKEMADAHTALMAEAKAKAEQPHHGHTPDVPAAPSTPPETA